MTIGILGVGRPQRPARPPGGASFCGGQARVLRETAVARRSRRARVRLAQEAGLVLGIGHGRRFEPAIQRLRAMLEASALGTIMHTETAFSHNKLIGLPPG